MQFNGNTAICIIGPDWLCSGGLIRIDRWIVQREENPRPECNACKQPIKHSNDHDDW